MSERIQPRISVILPTLNRAALLPRSIGSVLAQTHADLELIVVDDGSSDDIAVVVSGFGDARVRLVRHEQPRGPAAARNSGLAVARGIYVAFQDSDDSWVPHKLERQLQHLERTNASVALTISGLTRYRLDNSQWTFPETDFPAAFYRSPKVAVRYHADAFALAFTQTWLVKRAALVDVGGFNEALRVWEDWDLLLRLSARYDFLLDPTPLAVSYMTVGSAGANLPERLRSLERLQAAHAQSGDRAFVARLHYLSARYRLMAAERSQAWSPLLRALRLAPLTVKYWLLAGLLLAPESVARRALAPRSRS